MTEAKTIAQIIPNVLIEVSARPTKASPVNTKVWADWLNLQTHNDPEIETMVDRCAVFAKAIKNGDRPRWITLMGESGIGKTHCAKRLWKFGSSQFDWHRFEFIHGEIYWPKFVSELRSGNAFERLQELSRWPILFIDDIGAERDTTGFASEQINALLGSRMDKWTILTSNLFLEQLGAIDPRISDRIIRAPNIFTEVQTQSHSLRIQKVNKPYRDD